MMRHEGANVIGGFAELARPRKVPRLGPGASAQLAVLAAAPVDPGHNDPAVTA